jgi:hypothetical protein
VKTSFARWLVLLVFPLSGYASVQGPDTPDAIVGLQAGLLVDRVQEACSNCPSRMRALALRDGTHASRERCGLPLDDPRLQSFDRRSHAAAAMKKTEKKSPRDITRRNCPASFRRLALRAAIPPPVPVRNAMLQSLRTIVMLT